MKAVCSLVLSLAVIAGPMLYAAPAEAQQFYNPWHFHRTRQQLSTRAAGKRMPAKKVRRARAVHRKTSRSSRGHSSRGHSSRSRTRSRSSG